MCTTLKTQHSSASVMKIVKVFHVLGTNTCPYCVMLKGALMMFFKANTPDKLDKYVCFHNRDNSAEVESFKEEVGSVVPASHRGIPLVVAEYTDGSIKYVGGLDKFVTKFHC